MATDENLNYELMHGGADALEDFDLTGPEKLAILTADIDWIEKHVGQLNAMRRKWLESRRTPTSGRTACITGRPACLRRSGAKTNRTVSGRPAQR